MSHIPLPPQFCDVPFAVAAATGSGVGARRLRGSDLVAPHRGVRVPADCVAAADAIGLARLLVPVMESSWVFSHVTALALWGLPLLIGLQLSCTCRPFVDVVRDAAGWWPTASRRPRRHSCCTVYGSSIR